MTCSDVERVLPELLDGAPDGEFQTAFETHVKSCPACSDLVSDLKVIASEARQLAATEEPAPRVWVRIAAELRAEGLIREPESAPKSAPTRPILVPTSPRRRWSAWWLAPVAAALLAAGSYVVSHKPAPQVAKQQAPGTPAASPAPAPPAVAQTPAVAPASVPNPAPQQLAQKSATPTAIVGLTAAPAAEPEPSEEDQQFLSVVSTRAPSMRATYESQLQAVNADIREAQAYLDRNPGDADARQHLMDAYQQKALLYQIALDRIQ
ncbi:MAG: zf-HC2 domain-containing protein [Terriglobales bacterium]